MSGNPKPHDLGNGVVVFLPSWRSLELDGSLLEGKGIRPDILVETNPNVFASTDPILEKACEWLGTVP
jgi:C-terminal processing protease CtpA/Prc